MSLELIKNKIFYNVDSLQKHLKNVEGTVVWTNGCFDILHQGHLYSLCEARSLGDLLIVGLNSDDSVKSLKGSDRPINNQQSRAEMLAAMTVVDAVIVFEGLTPMHILEKIQPSVFAKGAEYRIEELPEGKYVQSYGGRLQTLGMIDGLSSSQIINQLLKK